MIVEANYAGADCILVDENGDMVSRGQVVTTFRGESVVVTGGKAPHKPGSTGKVYVRFEAEKRVGGGEFFPSVIGARWVPVVSEAEA